MPSGDAAGGVFSGLNHLLSYIFHRHHQFPLMFLKKEKKKIRKKKCTLAHITFLKLVILPRTGTVRNNSKKKKKELNQKTTFLHSMNTLKTFYCPYQDHTLSNMKVLLEIS